MNTSCHNEECNRKIRELIFSRERDYSYSISQLRDYKSLYERINNSKRYRLGVFIISAINVPRILFGSILYRLKRLIRVFSNREVLEANSVVTYKKGVSLIIPTYKKNKYIDKCLKSVIEQTLGFENIQVIVIVNGDNKSYYEYIRDKYVKHNNIIVEHTLLQGPAVARNIGLNLADREFISFLDDDDFLTSGYLVELLSMFKDDVNIVCGKLNDYYDNGNIDEDTYINDCIKNNCSNNYTNDYNSVISLFASVCAKVYRTRYIKDLTRFKEDNSFLCEDVIFWVDNINNLKGKVGCVNHCSKQSYMRRIVSNSRSRVNTDELFDKRIQEKLKTLSYIEKKLLNLTIPIDKKYLLMKIFDSQQRFVLEAYRKIDIEERKKTKRLVENSKNLFINKGLFSETSGVVFCNNFAPYADTSAYVATKRLDELNSLIYKSVNWDVVSVDMPCREVDKSFYEFFVKSRINDHIILQMDFGWDEKAQNEMGIRSFETVAPINYQYVYSRSMSPGSHIAAYEYKKRYPNVIWYAEFSDPLSRTAQNIYRDIQGCYIGKEKYLEDFWRYVELAVCNSADFIIFTNEIQKSYMINYLSSDISKKGVIKKSIVLKHPILPRKFCNIFNSSYKLDSNDINIAYFGTFYPNRDHRDMLDFLRRKDVVIHLFVPDPSILKSISKNPRIRINNYVEHLEFLNITLKMDYLFLNDIDYPGAVNPYLPSKLADYSVSGSKILAKVFKGTVLSNCENPNIIKFHHINEHLLKSLRKQK